jgi:outer membrane lipoprotein-sorting protein
MKILFIILLNIIFVNQVSSPNIIQTISPEEIIVLAEDIYKNNVSEIKTCKGLLVKREWVDGRDTGYQYIYFKYRKEPLGIYFKFLQPPSLQGREILYNGDDNVVVKRGGRSSSGLTVVLDVNSPLLTDKNRYTIKDFGIEVLAKRVIEKLKVEAVLPGAEIKVYNSAKIDDKAVILYRLSLSPETQEEANYTAELAICTQLNIPIYYKAVNTQRRTIEEYLFRNIELDVDFTEKDFEETNEEYGFRKYAR